MDSDALADSENRSAGELMLGGLLDESITMPPDDLPMAVRERAAGVGLEDARIYLVDKRQLTLVPFPSNGEALIDIATTPAGRCFRESTIVSVDDDAGGTRLWFPVLDGSDRLGVLAARVERDDDVLRTRGRQLASLVAELAVAKSKYGDRIVNTGRLDDVTLAAELRWAMLPPLTFVGHELVITGYLEPAYDIAGDTFDYAINGDIAHVAIFDAVGHGLEASRIANLALISYRNSRRRGLGFVEMYDAMDDVIERTFERSAYVTAQFATLGLSDGIVRWVSAGHPSPLLVRAGEPVRELQGHAELPVGIGEGAPQVNQFRLQPRDVVAFYSDGITEARAPDDEPFGMDRVADFLTTALATGEQLQEIVRRLVHAVVEHQGGSAVDDATLVLVGWRR